MASFLKEMTIQQQKPLKETEIVDLLVDTSCRSSSSAHDEVTLDEQYQRNLQARQQSRRKSSIFNALKIGTLDVTETNHNNNDNNYILVFYDLSRAGLLGVVAGASVAMFKTLIEWLRIGIQYSIPYNDFPKMQPFVPAIGGLLVGLLALSGSFPPGLRGIIQETDRDSKAIFFVDDYNSKQYYTKEAFLRKIIAAILTLGTGCSLGPEGPSVELGVNLSRFLGSCMNQIPASNVAEVIKHNRLLLSCGGAAGVAAGFNAPLSGIFFALEVIQGAFVSISKTIKRPSTPSNDTENLISTKGGISSIVLSAVLAALVSKTLLGDEIVFNVADYELNTPLLELPLYLLLGILCGIVAFLFNQLAKFCKQFFDGELGPAFVRKFMSWMPSVFKPMIGGLFCGTIGLYYPQILFFGYETLNNLLTKETLKADLLIQLLLVKMIATSVAAGSGLVGGTFAPSLFLGGMLGAWFHNLWNYWFGSVGRGIAEVPAYAMIGSASCLAALFRAPLTASLILFECTREYDVILPLMASAGVGSVVADLLETWMKNRNETVATEHHRMFRESTIPAGDDND